MTSKHVAVEIWNHCIFTANYRKSVSTEMREKTLIASILI